MLWEQRVCLADTQKPHRDDPEGSAPSLMGMVLRSHLLALLQSPRCAVALQPSPHAPPAAVHDPQVNEHSLSVNNTLMELSPVRLVISTLTKSPSMLMCAHTTSYCRVGLHGPLTPPSDAVRSDADRAAATRAMRTERQRDVTWVRAAGQVEAEVAAMVAVGTKAVSTRGLQAADCAVDPSLMDRYLDLSLLAQSCPHVVQESASLAQAFTLFRQVRPLSPGFRAKGTVRVRIPSQRFPQCRVRFSCSASRRHSWAVHPCSTREASD